MGIRVSVHFPSPHNFFSPSAIPKVINSEATISRLSHTSICGEHWEWLTQVSVTNYLAYLEERCWHSVLESIFLVSKKQYPLLHDLANHSTETPIKNQLCVFTCGHGWRAIFPFCTKQTKLVTSLLKGLGLEQLGSPTPPYHFSCTSFSNCISGLSILKVITVAHAHRPRPHVLLLAKH